MYDSELVRSSLIKIQTALDRILRRFIVRPRIVYTNWKKTID